MDFDWLSFSGMVALKIRFSGSKCSGIIRCIDRDYLVFTLRSMNLGQNNNATAQPVVSGKKIYPMLFPLPPLAEQKRIASKLKEILPFCKII